MKRNCERIKIKNNELKERPKKELEKKAEDFDYYIENLQEFTKETAESFREEGVPVDDSCRVDMYAFEGIECELKGIYSKDRIKKDQEYVDKMLKKFGDKGEQEKLKTRGEQLEMLKTCVFHKFLKDEFIVVRSSQYDDINNGVDNIIVERKTGKVLCAVDDVADNSGRRFHQKEQKIAEANLETGGAYIKYGLGMKDEKPVLKPQLNVPKFYLALSGEDVKKGLKDLEISGKKSNTEKLQYKQFISSMIHQANLMSLGSKEGKFKANENLMGNVDYFYNVLKKIEKKE